MFKTKTVDNVLKTFNKAIDDLAEIEETSLREREELEQRLALVSNEQSRARTIKENISKLIDI